ncbi:SRPBCC family protein [Paenibacillus sp. J5C_2022]|uniref:SRPBCC family protein n=1 Tax=Paenibacillus sp. J5C2022 TaxID=2977129 RepID=UPI0021D1E025|nr:SRPBCC family protein [Paenibacillus sp. J5C2022]MCU6709117.1 SRPBCC family protein [Paenibacillus sp. J5C2022]
MFNLESCLGAVTRTVSELEREGKPARNVTLERSYDTTPEDLWDAMTNPERLLRWFAPVSGELKLGGRYQIKDNAGGLITECVPPHYFSVTWEFGGGFSWVELRLAAEGEDRSRLTLSHICPIDDHWKKFGPGAVGVGWDLALVGLAFHLSASDTDRIDENAFSASNEGKSFMADCSEDWRRAAVAAGENPSWAEEAAKQVTAFYTGSGLQGAE